MFTFFNNTPKDPNIRFSVDYLTERFNGSQKHFKASFSLTLKVHQHLKILQISKLSILNSCVSFTLPNINTERRCMQNVLNKDHLVFWRAFKSFQKPLKGWKVLSLGIVHLSIFDPKFKYYFVHISTKGRGGGVLEKDG